MLLNKISEVIDPKLLKIWGLHMLIFYPICSFLEDTFLPYNYKFRGSNINDFKDTLEIMIFSPLNALWGLWEKFPFFIFMAFAISLVFSFFLKKRFFTNYIISLLISYLIVFLVHRYMGDIFYYIIPSITITLIIQSVIFRKEIMKKIKS